jgi:ABC-type multidrug transport system fused ATPase/permease subunit
LFFLGVRGARISENLVSRFLSQPLLNLQSKSPQNTLYAVGDGVSIVTLQVIASSAILISDLSLLVIMIIGLAVINPVTTAYMILVFTIVGIFLHGVIDKRAGALGQLNYKAGIKANEKIMEALSVFKELVVRNRRNYYARQIASIRFSQAATRAELSFMPYFSKYVIEAAVILGAVVIGLSQFFVEDVTQAVATMAIFLAAGSRLAPAVLRVQQGSVTIRTALAQAEPTLNLIENLSKSLTLENVPDDLNLAHEGFEARIEFNDVKFTFPGNEDPTLSEVSLCIPSGSFVAIVGPSGAGKTTLIDLMLGLLEPEVGSILVSGLSPSFAISKWPGALAYVPQEIAITSSTLRDNISLGYPTSLATDEHINSCIKLSQLEEFVNGLDHGINTHVGEAGSKLSGGERQRLGIARSLFTNPSLLVLDEATSSLDSETESEFVEALQQLVGKVTLVVIAHRLSTIESATVIYQMKQGVLTRLENLPKN